MKKYIFALLLASAICSLSAQHIADPNTEGVVMIDSDGLIVEQVLIFNRMGQIMAQSKSSQLDLSAFSSGLYFIQVIVGGSRVVRKVVRH